MYKTASKNRQHRARSNVLNDRANTGGVADDVFSMQQRRAELGADKKRIEHKIGQINASIHEGNLRRGNSHTRTISLTTLAALQATKAKLIGDLHTCETELAQLKFSRMQFGFDDHASFERTFMIVAKELLAHPVYERIVTATIHRCAEAKELDE